MRNVYWIKASVCCFLFFSFAVHVSAQRKKIPLKDSLDNAFDLSNYLIDANGFVPVPIIITEPALGGFGGGIAPIDAVARSPARKHAHPLLRDTRSRSAVFMKCAR